MPFVQAERLNVFGYRGIATASPFSLFRTGFVQKKDVVTEDPMDMFYLSKLNDLNPRAGDMSSITANCVASNIQSAALFPNDVTIADTWIFGVYVEFGFNTYERQQMDAWSVLTNDWQVSSTAVFGRAGMQLITWPLFAEEFAAESIPANHVIGCVRCTRTWATADWKDGGTFVLRNPVYWNAVDPTIQAAVTAFRERMRARVNLAVGDLPITPG